MWLVPKMRVHRALVLFLAISSLLIGFGFAAFLWKGMLFDVAWPTISATAVLVAMLAGSLAFSDQHRRLMGEQAARIGGELMAAQRIQMGLLPDPRKVFGNEARFEVAATLEPARRVGGDFYDCFMLDKNRLFFNIADVSGKGLAAALFMASAKSQIKSALLLNPHDVAGALNNAQVELSRENPEQMFVTVFAAILDTNSGTLDYVNAGHDAPFVRVPGKAVQRLEKASGPPLCVMDDFAYAGDKHQMVAGEWLFIMTDGVTEGTNAEGAFFGFTRLEGILNEADAAATPDQLVNLVMTRVHAFAEGSEPADDITLLGVRWGKVT
jgi:serine phosphatase RsbU (regulator of sigma subunit)